MTDTFAGTGKYFLPRGDDRLDATMEQEIIIDAVKSTKDNICINALAGAAKSTTLELICKYVTGIPILSLAFNKRIADELSKRLPSHVECRTLNSLGHRVWAAAIGKRLVVDTKKTYNIIKELIDGSPATQRGHLYAFMSDMIKAVEWAKTLGYVPKGKFEGSKPLINHEDYYDYISSILFEDDPEDFVYDVIEEALTVSIKRAYSGTIDYADQLYMPTVFGGVWPRFPLVLVDEAQDLSALNHEMLRQLARTRLIAVGDPWQSIYAFRGAVSSGMGSLVRDFRMAEFTLSVTFRCPISVVKRAQARVPHMKWAPWAAEGKVASLHRWSETDIPDGSAIICRNNAPLLKMAFSLLRDKRGVHMVGMDIGPSMGKTLSKLGDPSMPREEVHRAINKWETERLSKGKNHASISDKAECLRVFADETDDLAGAIAFVKHIFSVTGPILLMSGHKSKGLEFDTVFHLDPWRIRTNVEGEALQQELNVKYVIETRPKKELYLVTTEFFDAAD